MNDPNSSKPKVLFVIHLPPPIHGSAVVGSYIKNSRIINKELDAQYINLATNTNLKQSGKGSLKKLFIFFSLIGKVTRAAFSTRFDACYMSLSSRGPSFYKDVVIVVILKITGNNIVYHFHNKGVAEASSSWVNRFLLRFVFNKTKSILLSPSLYTDIKDYVKENDVFYCPNGIPPAPDNEKLIFSEKCKFLFLSNMMFEKGVYVLLDALKDLKSRQLAFECHYVGAWSDVTEVAFKQAIDAYGLEEVVFAHGPKYGYEKHSFFNETDVFIFPTFYHFEAFPIVNLEAMQNGLPVVSTYEGGIPDAIIEGENGFLVPQRNSKELADKLELLIHHPELRQQMGIASKKRFETYYTFERFETNFVNIIKEISMEGSFSLPALT